MDDVSTPLAVEWKNRALMEGETGDSDVLNESKNQLIPPSKKESTSPIRTLPPNKRKRGDEAEICEMSKHNQLIPPKRPSNNKERLDGGSVVSKIRKTEIRNAISTSTESDVLLLLLLLLLLLQLKIC